MDQRQVAGAISDYIKENPGAAAELQDPAKSKAVVERAIRQAGLPDTRVYQIVVASLGSAIILVILCVSILAALNVKSPDGVIAIGSAAVGGLAGLLAPSPASS